MNIEWFDISFIGWVFSCLSFCFVFDNMTIIDLILYFDVIHISGHGPCAIPSSLCIYHNPDQIIYVFENYINFFKIIFKFKRFAHIPNFEIFLTE